MTTENTTLNTNLQRRDFLRLMGIVSTGLMLSANESFALGPYINKKIPTLTSGFSALALHDDSVTLALTDPAFSNDLKRVITVDIHGPVAGNLARLVGETTFTVEQWITTIDDIRQRGLGDASGRATGDDTQRVAVGVGGIMGNVLTPFLTSTTLQASAAKDASIVRARSKDVTAVKADELESLMKGMITRSLTRYHTFIPDEDGIAWTQRLSKWRQDMEVYIAAFAKAYASNAGDKKFFDSKDPFVEAASASTPSSRLDQLMKQTPTCEYGKGIKRGVAVLQAVDNYWKGKLTPDGLIKLCKG